MPFLYIFTHMFILFYSFTYDWIYETVTRQEVLGRFVYTRLVLEIFIIRNHSLLLYIDACGTRDPPVV